MAGALNGIRILDLSNVVSGPMAVQILADQGADVIKIEQPKSGDVSRSFGESRGGMTSIFAVLNRNKRSIVLDFKNEKAKNIFYQLVADADVVVQNFRPGAMDRMGLGYEVLKQHQPDIIFVSISGYGDDGPYAERRAYDAMVQSATGYADLQAKANNGVPDLVKNIVCDKVSALTASQAITAALLARERGAGGQEVKLSMMDASLSFLWPDGMWNNTLLGEGIRKMTPILSFLQPTKTADGYVTCAALSDEEWRAVCEGIGQPKLATNPKYLTLSDRLDNWCSMMGELADACGELTTAEMCARMEAADAPFAKVTAIEDLHEDPQIQQQNSLVEIDHPSGGPMRMPRPVAQFEKTPSAIRRPSPMLGEHTNNVLSEMGLSDTQIAELRDTGVIE